MALIYMHMSSHSNQYVFSALLGLFLSLPIAAQTRSIVWPKEPGRRIKAAGTPGGQANALDRFDSFQIEDILVEGKPIIIGQPFRASDDWLNDVTVRIKNISQQTFAKVQMTLILPEIRFGPEIPVCYGCAVEQRGKAFAPGEEVELKTPRSDQFYNWVKTSITEKTSLSSITTAEIRDTLVVLSDGTILLSECVKTANPLNACPRSRAP